MGNFSKNKFLLCFRPVVDIDAMLESKVAAHRSASCRFSCIPVSDRHEVMKSSENKPVFFHQGSPKKSWIMQHPPKRTISKVIKAVVFETILNRRARHKNRYNHDCFGSKHNYSTYKETKALQSSLSTSSSASSSSSPKVSQSKNLTKYCSTKEKQREGSHGGALEKQKKFECYGICLVLISLAFTVLWGKLLGIILTSIWLYLSSLWDSSYRCQRVLLTCPRQKRQSSSSRSSLQCEDKGHLWKICSK